jgi:D-alanyl-D-alanine carboxypeptidase/D-alanyl-D-alanine endopeptidase (penicillin-binding protein 7)
MGHRLTLQPYTNKDSASMVSRFLQVGVLAACLAASTGHTMPLRSEHAIVISDETGQVVMEKSADTIVPIASLTKLLTAMVVLDSKPDMEEKISIESEDVDLLKHSKSHVPVGTTLPRKKILELALMSSDNRAAAALARTYPGGEPALIRAIAAKAHALGMTNTVIREPTGLSPENTSTATDLAKMALAASRYPQITAITTDKEDAISLNGRSRTFHNTNRLVGATGWDVLLSKTGFTNEAGHCLIMRIKQAGKQATLVLLNANGSPSRMLDALRIRQYLTAHKATAPVPRYPTVVAKR